MRLKSAKQGRSVQQCSVGETLCRDHVPNVSFADSRKPSADAQDVPNEVAGNGQQTRLSKPQGARSREFQPGLFDRTVPSRLAARAEHCISDDTQMERRWLPRLTMTMTMTHSEKSHIRRMKAWPYREECRGHDPTKKNLFY